MQSTKYSAEDEQSLMARLWTPRIKDNPLNFVALVFPWGVKGTPLENFKGPRKWQREVLQELGAHIKQNDGKIDYDRVDNIRGMNITFVTSATKDEEAKELLRLLGMPFSN